MSAILYLSNSVTTCGPAVAHVCRAWTCPTTDSAALFLKAGGCPLIWRCVKHTWRCISWSQRLASLCALFCNARGAALYPLRYSKTTSQKCAGRNDVLFNHIVGRSLAAPPLLTLNGALVARMPHKRPTLTCIPAAVQKLQLQNNQLSGSIPEDWQMPNTPKVRPGLHFRCVSLKSTSSCHGDELLFVVGRIFV